MFLPGARSMRVGHSLANRESADRNFPDFYSLGRSAVACIFFRSRFSRRPVQLRCDGLKGECDPFPLPLSMPTSPVKVRELTCRLSICRRQGIEQSRRRRLGQSIPRRSLLASSSRFGYIYVLVQPASAVSCASSPELQLKVVSSGVCCKGRRGRAGQRWSHLRSEPCLQL